jgi:uncharacterized repeat protein (TIGR01451 family)
LARSRLSAPLIAASLIIGFLLALPAIASATYSPELKRYPYLTDVVGNSATINWGTTRFSIAGVVKYGQVGTESCTAHTVTPSKTAVTVGATAEYQWKARLTLSPDTQYCYRLYLGQTSQIDLLGDDPSPVFKSQLPSDSNQPYSFAVFGDWGNVDANGQNPNQANVMQQIAQSGARFAVTTGDNAYPSGTQANYGDLTQTGADTSAVFGPNFWKVPGASMALFPTIGNHGFSGATSHFLNWPQDSAVADSSGKYVRETYCCLNGTTSGDYPSAWYAFDAGKARFYVLEAAWTGTNVGTGTEYGADHDYHWTPTSAEYKWLQNDLATHSRALKFAFFHYPLYSDNATEGTDALLQGSDSLEGLLNRYGVDIAFAGHSHIYERNNAVPNGLDNFVTGGGGATLQPVHNGSTICGPYDAFAIGWAYSANGGLGGGNACGAGSIPTDVSQVFHYLLVNVGDTGATVRAIDSQGRTIDSTTYNRATTTADLAVSQTDSSDPAYTGRSFSYNLSIKNNGPVDANTITLTDNLPSGVNYESATLSQGSCSQAAGVVTCKLQHLASGATATVDLKVTPQGTGTLTNTASVVGDDLTDPVTSNNSSTENTQAKPAMDLSITKTDLADPVAIGDNIAYKLTVKNEGALTANAVTVTDNLPSGVTYQSATPSQGTCNESSGTITCNLGDIVNGNNATIDVIVGTTAPGTVTNTASVTGTGGDDPDLSNNTASENTTVRPKADLGITKSDSPDPLIAGQTLTYSIAVQNNGPSDATGVTVTDNLPSTVSYQSATPSQGTCSVASGTVTCALGTVANGAGATIELKVQTLKDGTISNTARVSSDAVDPTGSNDSASADTTVNPAADMSITKTDSPDPIAAGQQLTYTLTALNNGPSPATGVTTLDTLPAGVLYDISIPSQGSCLTVSLGTISCNLGTIASGAQATVQIKVRPQDGGVITNSASVSANEPDLVTSNNQASTTTTVTPVADLQITKTASNSAPTVGQSMSYTLAVKNNGPSGATGVTTVDAIPSEITYQSASASQGSCTLTAGTLRCNLGNLAKNGTATVTINGTPNKAGNVNNTATVSGAQSDPVTTNNSSTANVKPKKK